MVRTRMEALLTEAIVYTNGNQECERLLSLLENTKVKRRVYMLDKDFTKQQFQMEFGGDAHYPQVAFGVRHIGGMKDALHYLKEKGLIH